MASRLDSGRVAVGAFLAGAGFALAGAPRGWWSAGVLGLLVLHAILAGAWARDDARPVRDGLVAGFAFGFGANAVALSWSVGLLVRFAGFPWVGALATSVLLWAAQALPHALAGVAAGALEGARRGSGWLGHVAALPVLAGLVPAVFPWRIGVMQLAVLPVAQVAEFGGEPLVDLLTVGCAGAVVRGLVARRPALLAAPAVVLALVVPWGVSRIDAVRAARRGAPSLAIGVVQPNVPVGLKRRAARRPARRRALREATRRLEAAGAQVVVWPETAHPYVYRRGAHDDLPDPYGATGGSVAGPLLVGAVTVEPETAGGPRRRFNSVLSIGRNRAIRGVSDKVVLVPFGERVPLCGTVLPRSWFEGFGGCGLEPGERPRVLPAAGARVGVLNCYEDVLPSQALRVARERPDVLVNVTNDAWFGATDEPHLHLLVSRMRAIEARRDLVRATNTGVSAHVLATGEVAVETPVFEPAAFLTDARLVAGVTPWARFGDWVTPLLAGALLAAAAAMRPGARASH